MSFTIIRNNTFANLSRVMLDKISRRAAKNMLALSSGKRINSTEDDASGYALANGLRARKRGLQQAASNIGNAQNLMKMASGAQQVIVDNLSTIRELVSQGADDSYNALQRGAIQSQIDGLLLEMDDTVKTTNFQGTILLNGDFAGRSLQIGERAESTFKVSLDDVRTAALGLIGIDVSSNAVANTSIVTIDAALEILFEAAQSTGEIIMRLDAKLDNALVQIIGLEASRSHIEDLELGQAKYDMMRTQLIQELGFNAMNQAVVAPRQVLSLIAP